MTSRFYVKLVLAACLALGASIWGVQSTAPGVLPSEDVEPPRIAASVQFPLPTIVEPSPARALKSSTPALDLGEIPLAQVVFHRAGPGEPIPDTRETANGAAEEVAVILPPANDGT